MPDARYSNTLRLVIDAISYNYARNSTNCERVVTPSEADDIMSSLHVTHLYILGTAKNL